MDIVTVAGTGRHVASRRSGTSLMPWHGVTFGCEQQGQYVAVPSPRVRRRDLRNLPTFDPQRPSAPSRWVT